MSNFVNMFQEVLRRIWNETQQTSWPKHSNYVTAGTKKEKSLENYKSSFLMKILLMGRFGYVGRLLSNTLFLGPVNVLLIANIL